MSIVRRSFVIVLIDTYLMMAIQFATSLVIARLLTPDQIGVFSVAIVVVSIAHTFREFGIVSYLIKEEHLTDEKIRAASALSFSISWSLAVIIFVASFPLASFYREPRLLHVLWILACNFLMIPFGSVVFALLRRNLRMVPILLLRVSSTVCSSVASIVLAYQGFGETSLALSLIVNQIVMVALVQFYRPLGMPRWPAFRGVRNMILFSAQSLTSNLVTDGARAAPDIVLGKLQNMAAVGLFSRAMGLVELFAQLIANSVWSVTLPYFAKLKREGGNVGTSLTLAQKYVTGLAWPFYAVLAVCAHPVILTLYGPQWLGSVRAAPLLCVFGAITCTTTLANTAMVAANRMDLATRMVVRLGAVRVAAVLASAAFGLVALAAALVVAAAIEFWLVMSAMRHALDVPMRALADGYMRSALVAGLCVLLPAALFASDNIDNLPLSALLALAACSVAIWIFGLFITRHPLRDEVLAVFHRIRGHA